MDRIMFMSLKTVSRWETLVFRWASDWSWTGVPFSVLSSRLVKPRALATGARRLWETI
jgi:hypothetical protein